MNALTTRLALLLSTSPLCRSFAAGIGLGALAWSIAATRRGDMFSFAMAMLLLLAGSASVVLHTLGTTPPALRAARQRRVHLWVGAIGCGVILAVQGLDLAWA